MASIESTNYRTLFGKVGGELTVVALVPFEYVAHLSLSFSLHISTHHTISAIIHIQSPKSNKFGRLIANYDENLNDLKSMESEVNTCFDREI